MLRLRGCIVSGILSSSFTSPTSSLHRLLSAAATATFPRISPNPSFAVEDYLVDTCGLTRPQALKASAKLSHLKSPSKPDAVLAFLAGIGLSSADVASLVAKDPRFLCASVERTLSPIVDDLADLGLSRSEIARLISLASGSCHVRCRSIVSKLHYYLPLFGSSENFFRVLKQGYYLLGADLERAVKPNVALLHECGLDNCAITKLCFTVSAMLSETPEHVQAMVASAEGIGVPHGSGMFREALNAVAFQSVEQIAAKVEFLKSTFKWSHAEVGIAVSKAPSLLRRSKDMLQRRSEFFISEVGLEPAYIAHRPIMITYSLEGRLRPRYYVVNFLIENGLLKHAVALNTIFNLVEKVFVDRYICPHKEAAPHLAEDYATACKGEIPSSFRFT